MIFDLEKAGREMALHLIGLGHRRIGMIQGYYGKDQHSMSAFRETRVSGLEHAMLERGIDWPVDELLCGTETTIQGGL